MSTPYQQGFLTAVKLAGLVKQADPRADAVLGGLITALGAGGAAAGGQDGVAFGNYLQNGPAAAEGPRSRAKQSAVIGARDIMQLTGRANTGRTAYGHYGPDGRYNEQDPRQAAEQRGPVQSPNILGGERAPLKKGAPPSKVAAVDTHPALLRALRVGGSRAGAIGGVAGAVYGVHEHGSVGGAAGGAAGGALGAGVGINGGLLAGAGLGALTGVLGRKTRLAGIDFRTRLNIGGALGAATGAIGGGVGGAHYGGQAGHKLQGSLTGEG